MRFPALTNSNMLFIFSLLLASLTVSQRTITLLDQVRDNITFVPFTPQERVDVANSMKAMFEIYVNRDKKIYDYDEEFQKFSGESIDPGPRIDKLLKTARDMSDREFNYAFSKIFLSLRDFHTNYEMGGPHRCFRAVQGAAFTVVDKSDWKKDLSDYWWNPTKWSQIGKPKTVLVVRSFSVAPKIVALSGPDLAQMNVGDEILTIDGISFDEYMEKHKWEFGGANQFGTLRSGLTFLSSRNGLMFPMPTSSSVTYKARSFNDASNTYTATLPWVASRSDACYTSAMTVFDAVVAKRAEGASSFADSPIVINLAGPSFRVKSVKENLITMGTNNALNEFKEDFLTGDLAAKVEVQTTADPIISWTIYDAPGKNLGVIFMSSFVPLRNDALGVTMLIRSLLVNELKDTNSLLFDIRDNGGGLISMADLIPQLFLSHSYLPNKARAIVSPSNEFLLTNKSSATDLWNIGYRSTPFGQRYTNFVQFTTVESANQIGQAYFKPTALLNNGNCFSACDLFSANMQDNGAATIFGEDGKTGAGGANVIEYQSFLHKTAPQFFQAFPYSDLKTPVAVALDARLGWRQTVRVAKNDGALIEDDGINADVPLVRPSQLDLVPSTPSHSQYDFIADSLKKIGQKTGQNSLYFQASPQLIGESSLGIAISFELDIAGISLIQVYLDGKTVSEPLIIQNTARQQREIRFDTKITVVGRYRFEIRGFDKSGAQIVSTYRSFRFTPSSSNYISLAQGQNNTAISLVTGTEIAQYDTNTPSGSGFVASGSTIRVGNGNSYADNVDSSRSYFFTSSSAIKVQVSVKATYDTEPGFDFFKIGYRDNSGVKQLLSGVDSTGAKVDAVSGKGVVDNTFTIPVAGNVEIFFQFISDGAVSAGGVIVTEFAVSA